MVRTLCVKGGRKMGKLYFRHGAMGASKTVNALMTKYNYEERGKKVVLLKPSIDTRDGELTIKSRTGLQSECETVETFLENEPDGQLPDCIIVDEAQFLTEAQVEKLARIADSWDVPIICYGLKTDFRSHLFEGSKRLLELADEIEEIPTICWCGRKARFNGRISNGKLVRDGETIVLGGNEAYMALCRRHYMLGNCGKHITGKE